MQQVIEATPLSCIFYECSLHSLSYVVYTMMSVMQQETRSHARSARLMYRMAQPQQILPHEGVNDRTRAYEFLTRSGLQIVGVHIFSMKVFIGCLVLIRHPSRNFSEVLRLTLRMHHEGFVSWG